MQANRCLIAQQVSVSVSTSLPWSPLRTTPSQHRRRAPCLQSTRETQQAPVEAAPSPRMRLVDVLLGNAASRIKRGTCTCIHCKGKGACQCPSCQGTGLVEPNQGTGRMNMMRHMAAKLGASMGDNTAKDRDWLQTNRCRRCHGVGELVCANCKGSGLRFKAGPDDACELPDMS